MEQLSFDFVQDNVSKKDFKIHSKLPIKRIQRGHTLVHITSQANFDIRVDDTLSITSTERAKDIGRGIVRQVWKGKVKDLPASLLQYHEGDIKTYRELIAFLFAEELTIPIPRNHDKEVTAVSYFLPDSKN